MEWGNGCSDAVEPNELGINMKRVTDCRRKSSLPTVFSLKKVPAVFRNPLPYRRLSAKPHQSKRIQGLG
jgi:hypothetical protein